MPISQTVFVFVINRVSHLQQGDGQTMQSLCLIAHIVVTCRILMQALEAALARATAQEAMVAEAQDRAARKAVQVRYNLQSSSHFQHSCMTQSQFFGIIVCLAH